MCGENNDSMCVAIVRREVLGADARRANVGGHFLLLRLKAGPIVASKCGPSVLRGAENLGCRASSSMF